jgi:hypothetical protein
MQSHRYSE